MKRSAHLRLASKALVTSIVVNCGMILASFAGDPTKDRSLLVRVADAIAWPPGVFIDRLFAPRQHTLGAFLGAITESLAFSVLFYSVVVLAILEAVGFLQRGIRKGRAEKA